MKTEMHISIYNEDTPVRFSLENLAEFGGPDLWWLSIKEGENRCVIVLRTEQLETLSAEIRSALLAQSMQEDEEGFNLPILNGKGGLV